MNLKILCWNVNGIRAVARKGFLEWFKKEDPDILCLQETKAHPEQLDKNLVNVHAYESYWSHAEKKGYSGVVTYSKHKPIKVTYGIGIDKFDREGRIVETEFHSFVLLNVYFPNGKMSPERLQFKMDFYDAFLNYVEKLRKKGKNIIICGDVNTAHKEIDLARPKENETISGFLPIERAWIDKFLKHGYVDTFREFNKNPDQYTWWSVRTRARERNIGWRIDYFYVNKDFMKHVKDSYILPEVNGSDHCPLGLKLQIEKL